jgi:hypothetical protein
MPGNPKYIMEIVPVDTVVNAVLGAAFHTAMNPPVNRVPIYHCATGFRNPTYWHIYETILLRMIRCYAFLVRFILSFVVILLFAQRLAYFNRNKLQKRISNTVWAMWSRPINHSEKMFKFWSQIMHIFPAYLKDQKARLLGQEATSQQKMVCQ